MIYRFSRFIAALLLVVGAFFSTGCVGMVIGTATDAAIEVGKIPFKVGGAVVDVATGGDEKKDEEEDP